MRRVVITGLGAVTPLGGDLKSSWKNLISGKSGASSITKFDATGYPCTIACEVPLGEGLNANDGSFNANDWISPKDQKKIDTFTIVFYEDFIFNQEKVFQKLLRKMKFLKINNSEISYSHEMGGNDGFVKGKKEKLIQDLSFIKRNINLLIKWQVSMH